MLISNDLLLVKMRIYYICVYLLDQPICGESITRPLNQMDAKPKATRMSSACHITCKDKERQEGVTDKSIEQLDF
jgi:hypothetical protein